VFFTSHEYVAITIFFQCVSLIELNSWKDEIFVAIKALQKGEKKAKDVTKKGKNKKKWLSLWAIHECSQIGCKMRWASI